MPHTKSLVIAKRIMCLKRYFDDDISPWKVFLSYHRSKKYRFLISSTMQFQPFLFIGQDHATLFIKNV